MDEPQGTCDEGGPYEAWISWIHGHHLIHIELAWMTDLLRRARRAFDEGDEEAAAECAARFRRLLVASGATMRYTGDFNPEMYLQFIRPAMPPGDFSGVYNREHRAMQKALAELKQAYRRRGATLRCACPFLAGGATRGNAAATAHQGRSPLAELEAIELAEIPALEDHVHVCRSKVDDRPSLMDLYNKETRAGWEKLLKRLEHKRSKTNQLEVQA